VITPNKAIAVEDSALGLAGVILAQGPKTQDLIGLYKLVSPHFDSAEDFLLTLDVLYILGRIDIDLRTRTVTYAD
jgi:hypothetical protein